MTDYFHDLDTLTDVPWKDDMNENRISEYTDVHITRDLLKRKNDQTPDFHELVRNGDNLVLVYGTLKVGGANFHLLEGSKYLGEGTTLSDKFEMRSAKGFPVAKEKPSSKVCGRLSGDVFAVDALTMLELDHLEGNNTLYTRQKKWVTLLDQDYPLAGGKVGKMTQQCWIYLVPSSDTSYDGLWLSNSQSRLKGDGTSVRTYVWDAVKNKSLYLQS